MRVFVTGATGFIGQAVIAGLGARGHAVRALTRRADTALPAGVERVVGDPTTPGAWQAQVAGCHAVVHLAGEPVVAGRFDAAHKARVMDSRREGTRNVVAALAAAPADVRPLVLLSSSGTDCYAFDESDRAYAESAGPGDSFLAEVCRVWEHEARAADAHGVRVCVMRTGIVLGKGGGPMAKLAPVFKWCAGGPLGSGRQWFPWVALEDAVGAFIFALEHDDVRGAVNVVSPGAVRQKDFARALGRAVHRPAWAPVPAFALRLAAGGFAEYLLQGRRVVPSVLAARGYAFRHAELATALAASL